MAENVTIDEIDAVRRHIGDALACSSPGSLFSEDEQDQRLAQACAEACAVLSRWVSSGAMEALRPQGRGAIADLIPDWQSVKPFLVPLGTTLSRLSERQGMSGLPEINDPEAYIDQLIQQAESTARRYRKFDREELFTEAIDRINVLRSSICAAAADFKKGTKSRAKRRAVTRFVLKKAGSFLASVALILVGMTPQAVAHDIPVLGHEAVKVLFVHHAAQTAQPGVRVAPLQVGPRLGG